MNMLGAPKYTVNNDILGGVFELDQPLLETCITSKQNQKHAQPRHVSQLSNNKQDANLVGSL
jgi:hypothetical protein